MIHVYTDGSFFEGFGGWAAVFLRDDGSVWKELSGGIRNADSSNNRAELAAVIEALDFVLALKAPGRSIELCIHTDSQYVQRIATGEYQRAANLDLWADFDELAAQVTLTWEWIPGHTGEPMNERADALARQAIADIRNTGHVVR